MDEPVATVTVSLRLLREESMKFKVLWTLEGCVVSVLRRSVAKATKAAGSQCE